MFGAGAGAIVVGGVDVCGAAELFASEVRTIVGALRANERARLFTVDAVVVRGAAAGGGAAGVGVAVEGGVAAVSAAGAAACGGGAGSLVAGVGGCAAMSFRSADASGFLQATRARATKAARAMWRRMRRGFAIPRPNGSSGNPEDRRRRTLDGCRAGIHSVENGASPRA